MAGQLTTSGHPLALSPGAGAGSFLSAEPSVAWILGAEALPAHIDPARVALRWGSEERTYAELRARTLSLAASLRKLGLARGDRVGAHLLNRGEVFELYFASAYAGLSFVPLSFRATGYELGLIAADCDIGCAFTQAEHAETLREGTADLDLQTIVLGDDSAGEEYEAMASGEPLSGPFEHADPHLILYTSGTTGRPKGVMMTHRGIISFALLQASLYPEFATSTRMLLTAPTFNTASINESSIPTFLAGGTVSMFPSRGWRPQAMAAMIEDQEITHTLVFPSMMEPLLEADRERPFDLASLRFVLTGGENCPPATMMRFKDRWPQASLTIGYGSSESGVVSAISDEEIRRHPGSVGRAAMAMSFRIQGPDGALLGPGEVGEIWAAGGSLTSGYWNAPELTAETLREGWLNCGDLGRIDADGYLFIEGRSRDLIISKGQNIYPAEIENVLSEHEDLLESTIVGVPDEASGEAVCAVVVLKPERSLEAEEVVEFVRARLASFKKPKYVLFTDSLPRTPTSKVRKNELSTWAIEELGLGG